ncbi:MAG: rhodanese-like domain-containing protein [Anaerolineae bacterium]
MSRSAQQRREKAKRRAAIRRMTIAGTVGLVLIVVGLLWWSSAQSRPPAITSPAQVQRIAVAEALALVEEGQAVLYDVRSRATYEIDHAEGAVSFPETEWQQNLALLAEDQTLIFYCT